MLTITDTRPATIGEWESAWRACGYATPFHSPAWAVAVAAGQKGLYAPEPLHVSFSDGLEAVVPFSRQRLVRGLGSQLVSSPLGTYGGWLASPDAGDGHRRLLCGLLLSSPALWWRLNPYDEQIPTEGLPIFDHEETQIITISGDFDSYAGSLRHERRVAARKAEKRGVTIRSAASPDDWSEYYRVYLDSLRRWGSPRGAGYSARLLDELRLASDLRAELWLAEWEGRIIAGDISFSTATTMVLWHGAALEECLPLRGTVLLTREVIRVAFSRELQWFDFNPSGHLEGVRRFKAQFGAGYVPAPVVWRRSFVVKTAAGGRGWARRLRRALSGRPGKAADRPGDRTKNSG